MDSDDVLATVREVAKEVMSAVPEGREIIGGLGL